MRVYEGDFTIKNLVEDCSVQPGEMSSGSRRIVSGIDLDLLAARLTHLPIDDVRQRKQRMEVFYQEMLLSADPDRGISFTSCLMILAHYNVIEDSQSLRLEEFLRRRARLQRVHESIRRNVVVGFFDMMYWSRRFRQQLANRRNSRLGAPPQIPEIFIQEEESSSSVEPHDFTDSAPLTSPTWKSPKGSPQLRLDTSLPATPSERASFDRPSFDRPSFERPSFERPSFEAAPGASPIMLSPTRSRLHSIDTSYAGPASGRTTPENLSVGRSHSRHASNVSGISSQGVMESFDTSAWGESIRRGLTQRRSK